MAKPKRKSLSSTVETKTKSEVIQSVLDEKSKTRAPSVEKDNPSIDVPLARVSTHISSALDTEMRVFIARRKVIEKGYNIRKFLESAIADKLAKDALSKMD